MCFLKDAAAQARFDFPLGPDRRAVKLHSVILPAFRKGAPPGTPSTRSAVKSTKRRPEEVKACPSRESSTLTFAGEGAKGET